MLKNAAVKSSAKTNSWEPLARPGCRRKQPDAHRSTLRKAIGPAANSMAPRHCYDFTAAVMVLASLHSASVGNPPA